MPIAAEIRSKWGGRTVKAAKSVRDAVYGKLQACRQGVRHRAEESVAGRKKDHRWDSLFAKRGVRLLMNCTGRSAARCT